MNATEAPVTEDTNDFTALHAFGHMGDDRIHVGQVRGTFSFALEVLQKARRIETFLGRTQFEACNLRNDHGIRIREGVRKLALENVAPGRVGARLEDGPDFLRRILDAQRAQGLAYGSRVMAEIIQDGHTPGDAADFHAPLDSFESIKPGLDLLVFQAAMFGGGDDGERVADVEFTHEVSVEFEAGNLELRGRRPVTDVECLDRVAFAEAEAFYGAVRDVQKRGDVGIVAIGEQEAIPGDQADKMFEGGFDRVEAVENICVIEFKIIDNGKLGEVVDEFASFIEECRVVFVALNDEPFAAGEAGALAEVVWNPPNQVAGVQAVMLEDPGEQGGGRGLSVRAANDDRAFAANKKFLEQLGQRAVAQFVVQDVFG